MQRISALALAVVLSSCAPQALPSGTSACTTANALIQAGWDGATGSLAGDVEVTNLGSSACVLAGAPGVELRADGTTVDLTITTYRSLIADQPQEAPPVLLGPGAQAHAFVLWANYCGEPLSKVVLMVTLPATSQPVQASYVVPSDGVLTPRCDAPDANSSLGVFPFAPAS